MISLLQILAARSSITPILFFSTPLTVEEVAVEEEEAVVEVVQVFLNSMHLYFWELWPLLWLF